MRIIGVLLLLVGLSGIGMGGMMFGDIGLAAITAGVVGILSGVGFLIAPKTTKRSET